MRTNLIALVLGAGIATVAAAEEPLSAIDWLSDVAARPPEPPRPSALETPITRSAAVEEITVEELDAPLRDAVGLLPAEANGFPTDLWSQSDTADLRSAMSAIPLDVISPVAQLYRDLLISEQDPPTDTDASGRFFLLRVDTLMARGAVEDALALINLAGATDEAVFRRFFDLTLLRGEEARGCAQLERLPGFAPSLQVRIFCLARAGDWPAAALTLRTAESLGEVDPVEYERLAVFLDPELSESPLPQPDGTPSPLTFLIMDAIGEPVPAAGLPLAYSHALLQPKNGWKARITAAERLTRAGALDANALFSIYGERQPAASGGAWDRIAAVRKLDAALETGGADDIASALQPAWQAMATAGLGPAFAAFYGDRLAESPARDRLQAIRIGLLSPSSEAIARDAQPQSDIDRYLVSLALGQPDERVAPDALSVAIADAFRDPPPPLSAALQNRLDENRRGEALLVAMATIPRDKDGDLDSLVSALSLLRQVGLDDRARQIALHLMLL